MRKNLFLIPALMLAACASPAQTPTPTLTPPATATFTSPPEPTLTPTITAWTGMSDVQQTIWQTAPEQVQEIAGMESKIWSREYGMVMYENAQGDIVAVWTANQFDAAKGKVEKAKMVDGVLMVGEEGKERILRLVVARVELAGNPFSGMEIFLEEADYWHNPHISQKDGDLGPMGQYVIELFTAGLIRSPQFAEGAMRLGTDDFLVADADGKNIHDTQILGSGWQSMIVAQPEDFQQKNWKDQNKRPVIPNGFPDKDGLGVWLPQIWLQQDNTYGVVWYLIPQSWFNVGLESAAEILKWFTEYDPMDQGGNALPVPIDFSKIDYCLEITAMPELEAACADMVANRAERRAAVTTMVESGTIPEKIQNGDMWFIPVIQRIVRP
jgi:hypothetical protein